jgi:hypothetical protein
MMEQQQVELCEQKLYFIFSLNYLVAFLSRFFTNLIIFHEFFSDKLVFQLFIAKRKSCFFLSTLIIA